MNNILRTITTLAASSALCGCAAMDSLHWSYPGPGDSRVISVDAKQRHLIMTKVADEDGKEQIRACAEPAPETFAAYSSSFVGLLGLAPDKRDAQASSATGETVASLERTQTVNLLREMLYRTCERWLSGALSKSQFLTLSARDHRSLVAVLAVEQLTGVVKPPSTIISGPAVSAAISQSKELVKLLASYKEERVAAEAKETTANGDYAKVNEDVTSGGATVKVCTLAERPTDDAIGAKWDKCKPAADKMKAAKGVADTARDREKSVLDQLENLSGGLFAGTKPGQQTSPESGSGQPGDPGRLPARATGNDLRYLTKAVTDIVLKPGIDEAVMFCIGYLDKDTTDTTTRAACNQILVQKATQDLEVSAQLYALNPTQGELDKRDEMQGRFEDFQARVAELINRTPAGRWSEFWNPFGANLRTQGLDCSTKTKCDADWNAPLSTYLDFLAAEQDLESAAEEWLNKLNKEKLK